MSLCGGTHTSKLIMEVGMLLQMEREKDCFMVKFISAEIWHTKIIRPNIIRVELN